MRIEALTPLKIKRPAGDMLLTPGRPVEFSDDEGCKLLERAKGKVRRVNHIWPGCIITWEGADLTAHRGIVDFLHTDPDGTCWVFVTLADRWAAVNTKFVTKTEGGKTP